MERFVSFADLDPGQYDELIALSLASAQSHAPGWLDDRDEARALVHEARAEGTIARVLLDAHDRPVGWVAATLSWDCVWELHPLLVAVHAQRRGFGRRLVHELETLVAAQGALTLTLSTTDAQHATSLAGVDLYDDPARHLATFTAHTDHAVTFWQRIGYRIVGFLPDAEGPGVPSITLAKRLRAR